MASRLYVLLVLLAASGAVLSTQLGKDSGQQEQLTLQQLQTEKEQLLKQLAGQKECQQKVKGLEEQNRVLRNKVDKDTPALEQMVKDASDQLLALQEDTSRWRLYLKLVVIAMVLTWGKSAFCLLKDGINRLTSKQSSDDKPSKLMNKKNK